MKEMFLCSDKLDKYQSMGENGQAVHISALQLRETLRLRKQNIVADTLAIPQINEHGDRIDWYSPFSGDVIPWSAATESERQAALEQLDLSQAALRRLSEEQRQQSQPEQRLFGQLLEKALQFPDQQHVWLVAGKPVISFWGFVNARHQARIDPLDCLRPVVQPVSAAAVAATSIPPSPPVAETAIQRPVRRGWWWLPVWLRWLLPFLLILLLALFLLRGCVPGVVLPGFSMNEPTSPAVHRETPEITVTSQPAEGSGLVVTGNGVGGGNGIASAENSTNEGAAPPTESPAALASSRGVASAASPAGETTPEPAISAESGTPGHVTGTKTPLSLPPEALAQGNTDFLNGQWHAGSGIQDQRTGKPLSLNYQIKNGQGEVRMVRGDGVACQGAVNAQIRTGQLAIHNQGEAQCSDGSVYQMPEILCAPGAKNIADCKGRYDANTLFPISMKQEASN